MNRDLNGNVITVCGPVKPENLGSVLMHEHLHVTAYDWKHTRIPEKEVQLTQEQHNHFMNEMLPYLKQLKNHGCRSLVDATFAPSRTWPSFYAEVSQRAELNVILCTGFYREVEEGTYWVKQKEDAIWPFVRQASIEELADFCIRDIEQGINGTEIHAGAIKLATSQPQMTDAEKKAFRAGARAQKATGVHITTHCTQLGAETSQLKLLDKEGVDLSRVVIGHTAKHLMDPECRNTCIEWMKKGAAFLPTNLGIQENDPEGKKWQLLVDAIHEIFDIGLDDKILFGLDGSFSATHGPGPLKYRNTPPPPYLHMFTHTLPAFRKMGLTEDEEEAIMVKNPQKVLPVKNS
jgi:phosphotriesterase-related protein